MPVLRYSSAYKTVFRCWFLAIVDVRMIYRYHAKNASPDKWCLKEKVLLGKWSAIAMLELQRIRFAGWALTEGQYRPKAGKKKKTHEVGLFFLVPASF